MTEPTNSDIMKAFQAHVEEDKAEFATLRRVLFGDAKTDEIGMKEKVDEMHKILTQAKGIPWFLGTILLVGGVIAYLKLWLTKSI